MLHSFHQGRAAFQVIRRCARFQRPQDAGYSTLYSFPDKQIAFFSDLKINREIPVWHRGILGMEQNLLFSLK